MRDTDFDNQPLRLNCSLHEALDHLRLTATFDDPAAAAHHLREHVATIARPDFCGPHQRPMFHPGRVEGRSCLTAGLRGERSVGVRLSDVIGFVNFLDAITDAADHLTSQRRGLNLRLLRDISAFPEADEFQCLLARAEVDANGVVSVPRSRSLVRVSLDLAIAAAGLVASTRWPPQRRPQLALVAHTTLALYLADVVMGLGVPPTALECSVCGNPYTPKRGLREGDGRYCSRVECQRKRQAHNQAKRRARASG